MIWNWDPDIKEAILVSVCKGHSDSVESISPSPDRQKVCYISFLALHRVNVVGSFLCQFCSGGFDFHLKIWSAG